MQKGNPRRWAGVFALPNGLSGCSPRPTPPPCPALADSRAWPSLPARVGPLPGSALFTRWRAGSSVNHPSSCGELSRGWSVRWTVLGRVPRSCDSVTTYLPPVRPRPATRPLAGSWTGSPARATARSRANEQIRISTPLVGPQAAHPLRDAEAPLGWKPRGSRSPLSYIPSRGQVRAPHGVRSPLAQPFPLVLGRSPPLTHPGFRRPLVRSLPPTVPGTPTGFTRPPSSPLPRVQD